MQAWLSLDCVDRLVGRFDVLLLFVVENLVGDLCEGSQWVCNVRPGVQVPARCHQGGLEVVEVGLCQDRAKLARHAVLGCSESVAARLEVHAGEG